MNAVVCYFTYAGRPIKTVGRTGDPLTSAHFALNLETGDFDRTEAYLGKFYWSWSRGEDEALVQLDQPEFDALVQKLRQDIGVSNVREDEFRRILGQYEAEMVAS